MKWTFATVMCLMGVQLLILGPWWLGILVLIYGLIKGWRTAKLFMLIGVIGGIISGTIEQLRTDHPPIPTGVVRVQPTAWKVNAGFATYTGTAQNGVPVTGGGKVDQDEERTIANFSGPTVIANPGTPERIAGPRNLYEFDYRQYAWAQYHEAYRLTATNLNFKCVPKSGIADELYAIRQWLIRRMNTMPERVAVYAKALLLGVLEDETDLRATFNRLGIIHMFSVSGLHIFAIVGMLYALTNRLRIPKEITDVLLLCILPALLVIIPPGAGIIRAVWMRLAQLIGQKIGATLTTFDYFCLVLGGNLLIQPRVLTTLGGQMTYLLTGVLIAMANAQPLIQSLRMALVSTPPLLHAVFGIHALTFVFNWLLMPIFEAVLMPALLIGCVIPTSPLVQGLDQILRLGEAGLGKLAALPGYIQFGALPAGMTLIMLLLVIRGIVHNRWRLFVGVAIGVYLIINLHSNWRVVMVDVGQGDSFLIEAPYKQATVLIDTGGRGFGQSSNPPAKRATLNYLAARGITHLDALVLTHPDADHVGDASVITAGIKVREIVTTPSAAGDETIQKAQQVGRTGMHQVMAGSQLSYGPLKMCVVAPNHEDPEDTNPNSVVLYGTIGDSNWLFTGDADQTVEQEQLMPQKLAVDILKVGHHGSKTASAPAFINQIKPKLGLISAGVKNRYGHPNQETLQTFTAAQIPLVMTNQSGMVWIDSAQNQHAVHSFLGLPGTAK